MEEVRYLYSGLASFLNTEDEGFLAFGVPCFYISTAAPFLFGVFIRINYNYYFSSLITST